MYTGHRFPTHMILGVTWRQALRALPITLTLCLLWEFTSARWLQLPALAITVFATAVSFYLGFKGNSAYGRLWEARKIWGGIVNVSRTWGTHVTGFIGPAGEQGEEVHKELLYRHIAWLAALRIQLRRVMPWEHHESVHAEARRRWGTHDTSDDAMEALMRPFVSEPELSELMLKSNRATQLLKAQSDRLRALREHEQMDDFRHMELANLLQDCFDLQGRAERIKNFPLPRQYATGAHLFVALFIQLLPFSLVPACAAIGDHHVWMAIPSSMLVAWVFSVWDVIVDFSENPFEGLVNDVPMNALSRTIEIDLRQMLGEADPPKPIEAIESVLL